VTDLTHRSPKTQVRPSPIHGQGLFAMHVIGRGDVVAVKGEEVLLVLRRKIERAGAR
jgi:hypothetical protein